MAPPWGSRIVCVQYNLVRADGKAFTDADFTRLVSRVRGHDLTLCAFLIKEVGYVFVIQHSHLVVFLVRRGRETDQVAAENFFYAVLQVFGGGFHRP